MVTIALDIPSFVIGMFIGVIFTLTIGMLVYASR